MVNSIRDNLDIKDTISEIKLLITSKPDIVCVLVEGPIDNRVLRYLLSENVSIIESFGGKRGIIEILEQHFPNEIRVIGIRDCDYGIRNSRFGCFYYDYSCLEMMILSIKSCYYRLYSFFFKGDESDADEFLLGCFGYLLIISIIRQQNEINRWKICFKGVNVASVFDENVNSMNENIVKKINSCNPDKQLDSSRMHLVLSLAQKKYNASDYLNITNGHDFISLFQRFCKNHSLKEVENSLFCSLGKNEFKETSLYRSLIEYQEVNGLKIV